MKKRYWVHSVKLPDVKGLFIDTCAICRHLLIDPCIACLANKTFPIVNETLKSECQELWGTLLMLRNRSNTLFNLLDIALLSKIYELSTPTHVVSGCPVDRAPCKHRHVYHVCCLKLWLVRRESCPLDNEYISRQDYSPSAILDFSPFSMVVEKVYQSEIPFVRRKEHAEQKCVLQSWLLRQIKQSRPERPLSSSVLKIGYKYFSKLETVLNDEHVDDELQNLISRGYISIEGETYKYIA